MNGAALYDIKEKKYMHTVVIKHDIVKSILEILEREKVGCFINTVVQDILLIYFTDMTNHTMEALHLRLRKSPHRNYINAPLSEGQDVLYLCIIEPTPVIERLAKVLEMKPFMKDIRMHIREEKNHEGYSYMRIYSPQDTRENMMDYLQSYLGFEKRITFSSIEGSSDVHVEAEDGDGAVRTMKKQYERYIWEQAS
ncbi:HAD hydrolase family protein [Cellulosilyticum ruminicola]|uniref:HAD hydrolase family protein n=1 Tax=Cellulosilyticum ruminicola TaxID=425254 RepID=UPI0006D193FA|nr:HAD hydrolase family protein [Cellulosilyticum ruminicola]